jgi:hypothetical protein
MHFDSHKDSSEMKEGEVLTNLLGIENKTKAFLYSHPIIFPKYARYIYCKLGGWPWNIREVCPAFFKEKNTLFVLLDSSPST